MKTIFLLYLFKIYVDDSNLAVEELEAGTRFIDGELVVVPEEVEADSRLPGDQRTARVIQTMANSISRLIQLTVDCPSLHQEGWMPMLDLQERVSDNNTIDFKHYRKPMANPLVILKSSANPAKVKRVTLVQEGIRILRNTRRSLGWETIAEEMMDLLNINIILFKTPFIHSLTGRKTKLKIVICFRLMRYLMVRKAFLLLNK